VPLCGLCEGAWYRDLRSLRWLGMGLLRHLPGPEGLGSGHGAPRRGRRTGQGTGNSAELPNVEWVACADTVPAVPSMSTKPVTRRFNLRVAREQIGIPKTYDDYHLMLEKEEFDVVRLPTSLAILEGTWTTWSVGVPTGPIVYGTRGALVVSQRDYAQDERPTQVVEVHTARSHGLTEPEEVLEGDPLPERRETLVGEFTHHLETGDPLHPTLGIEQNLEAMAILDAGVRSAATGKLALVDDPVWCVG
jgi:predicted dehydrogenase